MSRIGKQLIKVPTGVSVTLEGKRLKLKGPKGELEREFHPAMEVIHEDGELRVERPSDRRDHRALHGLSGSLLANMVEGVVEGFMKKLEIVGVGYRAEIQEERLILNVGYSHPVEIVSPEGVTITVARGAKRIAVEGVDKELVGRIAAEIRAVRKPEPYKGKGIRYAGEQVRRKAGKAGRIGGF